MEIGNGIRMNIEHLLLNCFFHLLLLNEWRGPFKIEVQLLWDFQMINHGRLSFQTPF